MGFTSTVIDVPVPQQFLRYDMWVMLISTIILLPIMLTKSRISRAEGTFFVITYALYLFSQIMIARGTLTF